MRFRNLALTRDFTLDHARMVSGLLPGYGGPPYCFVRFADGERAILDDRKFLAKADHWCWKPGNNPEFSRALLDSLTLDLPGWHVGITASSCHEQDHARLLSLATVPPDRITFAELFCYANFQRTNDLDFSACFVVGPNAAEPNRFGPRGHSFPLNAMEMVARGGGRRSIMDALDWLLHVPTGPVAVACGPVGKVLISLYWRATSGLGFTRRTVIDIGSGLGWKLHRRHTRHFQRTKSELNRWTPTW